MKIKTIAIIQIIIGVLVAIFPIYYFYTTYMNIDNLEYDNYLTEMVDYQNNLLEFNQEYKNVTFTPENLIGPYYTSSSTIYSSKFFYNQTRRIVIFENFIIFLIGIGFIFKGLYRLEKK